MISVLPLNAILLGFIAFIILFIVKNAKLLIITMNVQNAIQIIIAKNFLMGNILENAYVKKAITMISKIAFV